MSTRNEEKDGGRGEGRRGALEAMLHAGLHLMLSQRYISSYLPGNLAALAA